MAEIFELKARPGCFATPSLFRLPGRAYCSSPAFVTTHRKHRGRADEVPPVAARSRPIRALVAVAPEFSSVSRGRCGTEPTARLLCGALHSDGRRSERTSTNRFARRRRQSKLLRRLVFGVGLDRIQLLRVQKQHVDASAQPRRGRSSNRRCVPCGRGTRGDELSPAA